MKETIDLRSDTVTRPSPEMLSAISSAELGDDVFGQDPTVNRLQDYMADLLGKEACLFVPTGTMANQIAVRVHCQLGDELICESRSHLHNYEQGGFAQLSGVTSSAVVTDDGVLEVKDLESLIRPDDEHFVRTRLVCLENTHNAGGGKVLPFDSVGSICDWAHANKLKTHLDGARLLNAVVASGIHVQDWCKHFDTVSLCFSKGLGTPAGSVVAGSKIDIKKARRIRKVFGGGMRQVGIIASAAEFAIHNNVLRLAEDHVNAKRLATAIQNIPKMRLSYGLPDTNIVFFDIDSAWCSAEQFEKSAAAMGVLVLASGAQRIRAVTHLDVDERGIDLAISTFENMANA